MIVRAINGPVLGHPFFFSMEKRTAMATAVANVQAHTVRILCRYITYTYIMCVYIYIIHQCRTGSRHSVSSSPRAPCCDPRHPSGPRPHLASACHVPPPLCVQNIWYRAPSSDLRACASHPARGPIRAQPVSRAPTSHPHATYGSRHRERQKERESAGPLSVSGLCRAPALSDSVSEPRTLCVGLRRSACSGPLLSRCLCSTRVRSSDPCVHPHVIHPVRPPSIQIRVSLISSVRAQTHSAPALAPFLPSIQSAGPRSDLRIHVTPIQCRDASSRMGGRSEPDWMGGTRSWGGVAACHPSSPARSLFPGENPKHYCLGENAGQIQQHGCLNQICALMVTMAFQNKVLTINKKTKKKETGRC